MRESASRSDSDPRSRYPGTERAAAGVVAEGRRAGAAVARTPAGTFRLRVLVPSEVLLDETVTKVVAEAPNGHFGLLARHVDFVTVLVPGLLEYADTHGREHFLATDEGVLVKCGRAVTVSTRNAVLGGDLGELRSIVEQQFKALDEQERVARSAMARLEAGLVRRFLDFDPN